jgi:hypothetical protein
VSSLPSSAVISAVTPEQAYVLLSDFSLSEVAGVLEDVRNKKVIRILVLYSDQQDIWGILQEMDQNKSGSILLDMELEGRRPLTVDLLSLVSSSDSGILEYMLDNNITASAYLIEDTVKALVEGLDGNSRYQAVEDLALALNLVSQNNLEQLLSQIAGFPETPSTVAYMVEHMDDEVVSYVFNQWIGIGDYELVVNVLEHVTSSTLGVVYRGIGGENRLELFPFLPENIVSLLPDIGFFSVNLLSVTPEIVEPGEPVRVSFEYKNIGEETDYYSINVLINGKIEQTYSGILEDGLSESFELFITREKERVFNVDVESESVSFSVQAPAPPVVNPAEFRVENMQLVPNEIVRGDEMQVVVVVSNVGDVEGIETFELLIDNLISDFITTQFLPGETQTLVFSVLAEFSIGEHVAQVENLVKTFVVESPPPRRPWITGIILVLVFLGGTAYYLYENNYLGRFIPILERNRFNAILRDLFDQK